MWYKLNEAFGVIALVVVIGGGSIYGLVKFMSGPPVLRQSSQENDARQNPYTRDMMRDHDRRMRDIQEQNARTIQDAIEVGQSATSR